jgi:putative ABC transport system permease protein
VKFRTLGEPPSEFIYVPHAQRYMGTMRLLVKTQPGVQPIAAMRRMMADIDRNVPILDAGSLEEAVAPSLFPQRVAMWVAGSLGAVALLLALLGIYGVISFSVAQRTREMGVRVALGADQGRVLRMVLRQGLVITAIGIGIGAAAAAGVTRLMANLLYGLAPTDGLAFAGAAALLGGAALIASWVPARRAAAVDPVIALRAD